MRDRLKWVNGGAIREHDLSRRRLLEAAAAAAVGASALGESSSALAATGGGKVPRGRRALMQETVRALVVNSPATYPTLPAGYRQVFEAVARIGFTGFEFLSYSGVPSFPQHPSAEGGASVSPTQIRAWLDESGLEAIGHYNASTTPTGFVGLTPATIDAALASAQTLGQPQTGSLDATQTYRQKDEIDPIVETWNRIAVKASKAGIPIYTHAHSAPGNFLLDTGPRDAAGSYTRSSGVRVMEYFLQHTDPRWVKLEIDIFWASSDGSVSRRIQQGRHDRDQGLRPRDDGRQVRGALPDLPRQGRDQRAVEPRTAGSSSRPGSATSTSTGSSVLRRRRSTGHTGAPSRTMHPEPVAAEKEDGASWRCGERLPAVSRHSVPVVASRHHSPGTT